MLRLGNHQNACQLCPRQHRGPIALHVLNAQHRHIRSAQHLARVWPRATRHAPVCVPAPQPALHCNAAQRIWKLRQQRRVNIMRQRPKMHNLRRTPRHRQRIKTQIIRAVMQVLHSARARIAVFKNGADRRRLHCKWNASQCSKVGVGTNCCHNAGPLPQCVRQAARIRRGTAQHRTAVWQQIHRQAAQHQIFNCLVHL